MCAWRRTAQHVHGRRRAKRLRSLRACWRCRRCNAGGCSLRKRTGEWAQHFSPPRESCACRCVYPPAEHTSRQIIRMPFCVYTSELAFAADSVPYVCMSEFWRVVCPTCSCLARSPQSRVHVHPNTTTHRAHVIMHMQVVCCMCTRAARVCSITNQIARDRDHDVMLT